MRWKVGIEQDVDEEEMVEEGVCLAYIDREGEEEEDKSPLDEGSREEEEGEAARAKIEIFDREGEEKEKARFPTDEVTEVLVKELTVTALLAAAGLSIGAALLAAGGAALAGAASGALDAGASFLGSSSPIFSATPAAEQTDLAKAMVAFWSEAEQSDSILDWMPPMKLVEPQMQV